MKIALAQVNPTVGDFKGNLAKILSFTKQAERRSSDLCIFPEMAITGYPARDLLLNRDFIDDNLKTLDRLAGRVGRMAVIVGYAARSSSTTGKGLFNAGAFIREGKVRKVFHKMLLPAYDVFDEDRYFDPADHVTTASLKGTRLGLSICEDIWNDPALWKQRFYTVDPVELLAREGAELLVTISASPFTIGRRSMRRSILKNIAAKYQMPVVYVNQVGGNDQLVFDGCSLAVNRDGELLAAGRAFGEDLIIVDTGAAPLRGPWVEEPLQETVYDTLSLGVRDYARKCGFRAAVIGLSGGIDSAVTACIAVSALGSRNVHGVAMPSPYSSPASLRDARALAANLGIKLSVVPIAPLYRVYLATLTPHFCRRRPDETEENIQARIRGNILMALSNKFGCLVLSTGNKSELAVGYCTLYGDMSGGLAALSDVPKTLVYALAHYINRSQEIIPAHCITRAPSAELKPRQTDQDSLPPYEVLDAILARYIEKREKPETIIAAGFNRRLVREIVRRVEHNEYKREQAPPGLKITSKAFGLGRRMPLAQRYY